MTRPVADALAIPLAATTLPAQAVPPTTHEKVADLFDGSDLQKQAENAIQSLGRDPAGLKPLGARGKDRAYFVWQPPAIGDGEALFVKTSTCKGDQIKKSRREQDFNRWAAGAQFAPPAYQVPESLCTLVSRHIPNATLTREDLNCLTLLRRVLSLTQAIHAAPSAPWAEEDRAAGVDYLAGARGRVDQAEEMGIASNETLAPLRRRNDWLGHRLAADHSAWVNGVGDLHFGNLLWERHADRLYKIDWEDARQDKWFYDPARLAFTQRTPQSMLPWIGAEMRGEYALPTVDSHKLTLMGAAIDDDYYAYAQVMEAQDSSYEPMVREMYERLHVDELALPGLPRITPSGETNPQAANLWGGSVLLGGALAAATYRWFKGRADRASKEPLMDASNC